MNKFEISNRNHCENTDVNIAFRRLVFDKFKVAAVRFQDQRTTKDYDYCYPPSMDLATGDSVIVQVKEKGKIKLEIAEVQYMIVDPKYRPRGWIVDKINCTLNHARQSRWKELALKLDRMYAARRIREIMRRDDKIINEIRESSPDILIDVDNL